MIQVKLSQTEINILYYVGKYRHHITKNAGEERKQDQSLNGETISVQGVMSEYAVAKALNLHFDFNCDYRKFGADLILHNGNTIDVKSTLKHKGNLNAVGWSGKKQADYFVLTEIHYDWIGIVGCISREEFLQPEYLKNVGNGSFYSAPQHKLKKIDEFIFIKAKGSK